MFYVVSQKGEELAAEDSFTNAVFELMSAPKGAEIFAGETSMGITSESEVVQLLAANPMIRVCDAFETERLSKALDCNFRHAAIIFMNQAREESGVPCTTEILQYAGSFGIKDLFLTPANKWK